MNITSETTVADLERARLRPGAAAAAAARPDASSSLSSWPDLLRLLADILQEGIPLLEKGGRANVFQLLTLFAKVQAAWQAYKALRRPAEVRTLNEIRAGQGLPPLE